MLNSRLLFVLLAAVLALSADTVAVAYRYQNQSGLVSGSFVWNPTIAPEGALAIVVSTSDKTVHVYRHGVEIGISTATVPAQSASAAGIFVVSQVEDLDEGASSPELVWRGMQLYPSNGGESRRHEGLVGARLPSDLAELLMHATNLGAAVIVARERTGPQLFSAPGPFVDPVETGSLNRIARFARPELGRQTIPPETSGSPPQPQGSGPGVAEIPLGAGDGWRGQITSVILSRADLSAYVMKGGMIVDRLPIAVKDPTEPFGLHAVVLVSPGDARSEAKWLGFGIAEEAGAAHVASDGAEQALRRVRFLDKGRSMALARAMNSGTVVVLIDGHGPSVTEAPLVNVALLQSEDAVLSSSGLSSSGGNSASAGPPKAATKDATAGSNIASERGKTRDRTQAAPPPSLVQAAKKVRSASRPQGATATRRRGPLDHREDWPNSIYWPY